MFLDAYDVLSSVRDWLPSRAQHIMCGIGHN